MNLLIIVCCIGAIVADRLENTYLPPNNARTAGGNGNFLNAPHQGNQYNKPSTEYGAPINQGRFNAPSNSYGTPVAQTGYNAPSVNYVASSSSRSNSRDGNAATLRFENVNNGDGSYKLKYETDNKISHQEFGEVKNIGNEQATVVKGSYSFVADDGKTYTVNYVADENGFHATGDHIPTPPPVPEAIQKSLNQISQQGNSYSGNYQSNQSGNGQSNYNQQQYSHGNNYQENQATNRQYLAPNKPSFNQQSGYQY